MTHEDRVFTRIEQVEHHPDLCKIYDHHTKLVIATAPGGWPALFGTSNYKRLVVRRDKMAKRFVDAASKKFNITYWIHKKVDDLGPCVIWDEAKNERENAK